MVSEIFPNFFQFANLAWPDATQLRFDPSVQISENVISHFQALID